MTISVAANMSGSQTSPQTMVCQECNKTVNAMKYAEHVNSDHELTFLAQSSPATQKGQKTLQLMTCEACGATVDAMQYADHINSEHRLYTVNIKGVGPQIVQPQNPKKAVRFLDIPYYGHVRADAFVIVSLGLLILGVLMGSGALR